MNSNLSELFKEASESLRSHTSTLRNSDGEPAKPGDLLIEGDDFDTCKKGLVTRINKDDLQRVFVIADSQKASGLVVLACKGNGDELGLPSQKKPSIKIEHSTSASASASTDTAQNPAIDYLFTGLRVMESLNDSQLQQAADIAIDQSQLWFWLHLGRITGSNAQKAKSLGLGYLKKLKAIPSTTVLFQQGIYMSYPPPHPSLHLYFPYFFEC